MSSLAFVWTRNRDIFQRVVVCVLDRFTMDATRELSVLGSVIAAISDSSSVVAHSGCSLLLAEACVDYLGNDYRQKLLEYPIFELRLLKQRLQKVSSSVFGRLDPFP